MRISCDTNVLVYATETLPGSRSIRARDLIARAMRAETAVLLLQSLAEFSNVAIPKGWNKETRPYKTSGAISRVRKEDNHRWIPTRRISGSSRKGHGHPFPVTGGALIGACFPPIRGWCRHDDSHFLRALGTKQCQGVSKDDLVRHMLLQRHDELPLVGKKRHW
jgi:hypothetical protein